MWFKTAVISAFSNTNAKEENRKHNDENVPLGHLNARDEQLLKNSTTTRNQDIPETTIVKEASLSDQKEGTEVKWLKCGISPKQASDTKEITPLGQGVVSDEEVINACANGSVLVESDLKVHGSWCSLKHRIGKAFKCCSHPGKLNINYIPPYQIDNRIFMRGHIERMDCRLLFDSDSYYSVSGINMLPKDKIFKLRQCQTVLRHFPKVPVIYMYEGDLKLQIGNHLFLETVLLREYAEDVTLGRHFLKCFNVRLDYSTHVIEIEKRCVALLDGVPLCDSSPVQIDVTIEDEVRKFGLCTGSYITVVNELILSSQLHAKMKTLKKNKPGCRGVVEMNLTIAERSMGWLVYVADMEGDGILGADFFSLNECKLCFENGVLQICFKDVCETIRYEIEALPAND